MYKDLYKYFATKIVERMTDLMNSSSNSEYFIVFSGIFNLLGMEQNLNSFNYETKEWYKLNEKTFLKGIYDELLKLNSLEISNELDGNNFYTVKVNNAEVFNLFPYFVDEDLEDGNKPNFGKRGYAGKLRDNQSLRKSGNVILIFDNNPIATLSSASDSEVLLNIFSKENIKKDILNEHVEEWIKVFGSVILNDNYQPHTLNIIDRINLLLLVIKDNANEINERIKKYRLPLFFFGSVYDSESVLNNFKLFRIVSNQKLEKNTTNFYKEIYQTLNLDALPSTVSEKVLTNILRTSSIHESQVYNHPELTWEKINEILNEQPSIVIGSVDLEVDNGTNVEFIAKNKKLNFFFVNKQELNVLNFKIEGDIISNRNVFVHYFFNDFNKQKVSTEIKNNISIDMDNPDYKSLTFIINKFNNKITSPIYTAKILFLNHNNKSTIVPDIDIKNIDWTDGIYPTVVVEEELDNISELNFTLKEFSIDGNQNIITGLLNNKEEIQDLPDVSKFNVQLDNSIVTSLYVKQKDDQTQLKEHKHLIHFLINSSKDVDILFDNLNSITFDIKKINGFYFENQFINYSVEEEFNSLIKEVGLDNIEDLYNLILKDKKHIITKLPLNEEEDASPILNNSNSDIIKIVTKRAEVLQAFENIYTLKEKTNLENIRQFNKVSKEYLNLFTEHIGSYPFLAKIDCLDIGNQKVIAPFAPVNLAFLIDMWEYLIDSVTSEEVKLIQKRLLESIDNSEVFKYIKSDSDWYISKKTPALGWLLYSKENDTEEILNEKYLDDIVYTKIRQLENLYKSIFVREGQTLHIAAINPGDSSFILKGVSKYIEQSIKDSKRILPKFHISLIFKDTKETKKYTAFDKLFDMESEKNKDIVNNLSYTKITNEESINNKNIFYHIIFIKDIFETNNTSPKNMYGLENQFYDTYFAYGFQCHPIRKAITDQNQETLTHIDYVSFNNYLPSTENGNLISRRVFNSLNKYFVQSFQTQIETNEHPLRRVRVALEDIPYNHFNKGFIVTFLDKEIDVDIFNSNKLKDAKKPFLLDYTDFEEDLGLNTHRFITITNQKAPFNEIFKMALKEVTAEESITDRQIEKLFDEVNLLNGFWVLRILDRTNESLIKGMLGTVAASIFMRNLLHEDQEFWHFIISLEEIVGATKSKQFKGLKQKYADENQLYSDDLAVISFPKNMQDLDVNISITLIEIKNSSNVEYVKKGFKQLVDTKKLLEETFIEVPKKIQSLRFKEIISWLIYHNKKHEVFSSSLHENNQFEKDLHQLITNINNSIVHLNINDGILININDDVSSIEQLEIVGPNYIYIRKDDYIKLLLEQGDNL